MAQIKLIKHQQGYTEGIEFFKYYYIIFNPYHTDDT